MKVEGDLTSNNYTNPQGVWEGIVEVTAWIYSGSDTRSAAGRAAGYLILRNFYVRLLILATLIFQVTANVRKFRNFFGGISRFMYSTFGACRIKQFTVPADEEARVTAMSTRQPEASSGCGCCKKAPKADANDINITVTTSKA